MSTRSYNSVDKTPGIERGAEPGQFKTEVGSVKGNKQLRFLGHVMRCEGDKCPIRDFCTCNPTGRSVQCTVLKNFMTKIYYDWVEPERGLGDVLNQYQLDRIGTHLMPLYHHLARLSMEISNLGRTTYESEKTGGPKTYPQFDHQMKVMAAIRAEEKELNLSALWEKKFGDKQKPEPVNNMKALMKHGDPEWHDKISK